MTVVTARLSFRALTFNDGTTVDIAADGITVLVGPNNAGKSATLRELASYLATSAMEAGWPEVVLRDAGLSLDGTADELVEWLQDHAYTLVRPQQTTRTFRRRGGGAEGDEASLREEWQRGPITVGPFGHQYGPRVHAPSLNQFLLFHATADQRLGLIAGSQPHNPVADAPSSPMQALFTSPDLERTVSDACLEAFRTPLHLSRMMGAELNLYVGAPSAQPSVVPTAEYIADLARMPLLNQQGDGMRSFMGLLLALITGQFQVLLIDEPEAFLHPPQARLLGRRIAGHAPDGQVIVATHDVNFLKGLLEGERDVVIVRLTREGSVNRPAVLATADVRGLWNDPILHHTNVLEALFHRGAILCEADTDARFYGAVLEASTEGGQAHDLLLAAAGGKAKLPVLARSLRAVGVGVAVIVDFDLFRTEADCKRLAESVGGTWGEAQSLEFRRLANGVDALGSAPPRLAVQESIVSILDGAESVGSLNRDDVANIKSVLRLNDGWLVVKRGGLSALPAAEVFMAAERLLAYFASIGIFVVPVGELERWCPAVGGHGSKWVTQVLDEGLHTHDQAPYRAFVDQVAAWF